MNFLDRFSKKSQISGFIKIRPVGAELFHADRQTDMTKLIVAFRNFANAPKKAIHTPLLKLLHLLENFSRHFLNFFCLQKLRFSGVSNSQLILKHQHMIFDRTHLVHDQKVTTHLTHSSTHTTPRFASMTIRTLPKPE